MENKLVIFDLDGTLCDTLSDLTFYINYALKEFGYKERTVSEVREYVCVASREFMRLCMGEKDSSLEIIDKCHDYYAKAYKASGSPRTRLYVGIDNLVRTLKENGCKLVILTNKDQDQTNIIYDKYIKQLCFDNVIGIKDGVIPKPDPTEILKLIKEYNVTKENTYFIGDGDTDVLAAINAGVNLIAVTYGYRDKDVLISLGAKVFADSPEQILHHILKTKGDKYE